METALCFGLLLTFMARDRPLQQVADKADKMEGGAKKRSGQDPEVARDSSKKQKADAATDVAMVHVWLDRSATYEPCSSERSRWSGFSSTLWYHDGDKCTLEHPQRNVRNIVAEIGDEHLTRLFSPDFDFAKSRQYGHEKQLFYIRIDFAKLLAAWDALRDHTTVVVSDIDAMVPGDVPDGATQNYMNVNGGIESLSRNDLLPYFDTAKRFGMVMNRYKIQQNENSLVIFHKSIREALLEVGIKLGARQIVEYPEYSNVHTILKVHQIMFEWHMFTLGKCVNWSFNYVDVIMTYEDWQKERPPASKLMEYELEDRVGQHRGASNVNVQVEEVDGTRVRVDRVSECYVGAVIREKGTRVEVVGIEGDTLVLSRPIKDLSAGDSLHIRFMKSPWVPVVFEKSQFERPAVCGE